MTKQDLLSVFYVDSHDKVPEYELSSVRFLSKRSISENQYSGDGDEVDDQSSSNTKHVQLKAFGKKMSLKLQDNNDFNERVKDMKVFIAESSRNGKLKYMEDLSASIDDGSEGPGPDDDEMFLNEDDFAQMRDYNQTTTTLSDAKMKNHTTSKYPILKRRQSPLLDQNLHVIFKRNVHQISPHHSIDFAELEHGLLGSADIEALRAKQWLGDLNATLSRSRSPRRKRQAPGTVWPEVLLVVDYDSFMLHGATSRDVKRYFISFWNGVDLRYKLLVHPQIRVSLAGMIVAKDRDATPYLERNRLRPPNADAVDAAGALTDMGKYLYREDRLPTYDMAVVITKLDMCRRRYEGGRCNRGTAGFAYVGGACVVNKRLEKVNSVAIIEDSGGYSGIIVAAHEVGHLLGCVHDGSPPPSYLGGPGATHCPWEDGFIMSDLRHTERGFRWSSCSVEQFKHFLNASGYCVSYRPAAEGSPCGDGQICRNGKCLAEMENIIPDYSHVQQAISRGPKSDRILSRIDHGPMHHHLPPYRRSLRFRGRESFFNNYLRGAASEQQPNVLSMI
ncbi:A disintegrin and metalloproteinase with thrombospondin motifs 16-like protein 1 [Sarcoptes scabiei]|uniref:A disintegrin and metalloproteinase with thrombospondin motifs 16-like protein 1 n=1 Tax=Sarcoptes scabiei TaxID=52283 RepID=A0A131ZUY0_SARSC|nr:A disintegrin and metalloproteinase with thrombospondin motifs 16-like protein 1 [Sarcoptes scabiei]